MSTSRVAQLANVIKSIPPTPFRTSGSPQLSDALDAIVTRAFRSSTTSNPAAVGVQLSSTQQATVDGAIVSVERLKAASALNQFPLSEQLLHPRHDPHYYNRMREGVHRSAQGIGRSWWKRFFQVRGQV